MSETRSKTEWTSERIHALRTERGQTQIEFGLELMDCSESYAHRYVSELENGRREPSAAVRRTLRRMEAGEV